MRTLNELEFELPDSIAANNLCLHAVHKTENPDVMTRDFDDALVICSPSSSLRGIKARPGHYYRLVDTCHGPPHQTRTC